MLVYCINDGAVMKGWAKDQGVNGSMITFLADTRGEFTKALGMFMIDHPGPKEALGNRRCKRFALICNDGIVTHVEVSEAPDDPAGDNEPDGAITARTRVENILEVLASTEKAEAEKVAEEKAAAEKALAEKATEEKAAAEKAAEEKAATEKAAEEKASAKAAEEKAAAAEKAAEEKTAEEKAAAEKAPADKAVEEKAAAGAEASSEAGQ